MHSPGASGIGKNDAPMYVPPGCPLFGSKCIDPVPWVVRQLMCPFAWKVPSVSCTPSTVTVYGRSVAFAVVAWNRTMRIRAAVITPSTRLTTKPR